MSEWAGWTAEKLVDLKDVLKEEILVGRMVGWRGIETDVLRVHHWAVWKAEKWAKRKASS